MAVKVYQIKPHHAEFGKFHIQEGPAVYEGTLGDYLAYVNTEVGLRELTDEEIEDTRADGNIEGQCGVLIGWEDADGKNVSGMIEDVRTNATQHTETGR